VRRKALLFIVVVLLGAAVAVPLLRLAGRVSLHELAVESLEDAALPELLQRLRDFHRVVTRDGQKVLEISAKEASFFRDTSAVEIVAPKVLFFDKGEQVGEISGGKGNMMLNEGNVSSVEVTGGVRLAFVQFEITAEDVAYDREARIVTARGPATMRSDEFEVTGTGMTVDLGEQILRIPGGVRMQVYRTGAKPQWRLKRVS
jgi:LPS export ABC transporter protein LptC